MLGNRSAANLFKTRKSQKPGGGSKKHSKNYYLLALDFDGCAAGMFTHTANTDGAGPGTYAIDTNHPIYKHIQNLRTQGHSVVLFIGSNRQSDKDDIVRNEHGRCIDAYSALERHLNESTPDLPSVDFCSHRLSDDGLSPPETKFIFPTYHCSIAIKKYNIDLKTETVTYELIDDRGLPTEPEIQSYLESISESSRKEDFMSALKRIDFMSSLNLLFEENPEWLPAEINCILTPFLTFRGHEESVLCKSTSTRGKGVVLDVSDIRDILDQASKDREMALMDRLSLNKQERESISGPLLSARAEVKIASEPQPDSDTKHEPSNPSLFCKFAVLECEKRLRVLQSFKNVVNKQDIAINPNLSKTLHQKIITTEKKLNQFFGEAKKIEPNLTILARRLFKSKKLLNEAEDLSHRACSPPVDGGGCRKGVNGGTNTARLGGAAGANGGGASAAGQQCNQNSGGGGGGGSKEEGTLTRRM